MFSEDAQVYIENEIANDKTNSKSKDFAENLNNFRNKALQSGMITPFKEMIPQQEVQTADTKINKKTHERLSAGLARILQMIIDSKQQKINKISNTRQLIKNKDNLR